MKGRRDGGGGKKRKGWKESEKDWVREEGREERCEGK